MREAIKLLQALTEVIPPKPGQHHALTLLDDCPSLMLHVIRDDKFITITLDEDDLDRDGKAVAKDVLSILNSLS